MLKGPPKIITILINHHRQPLRSRNTNTKATNLPKQHQHQHQHPRSELSCRSSSTTPSTTPLLSSPLLSTKSSLFTSSTPRIPTIPRRSLRNPPPDHCDCGGVLPCFSCASSPCLPLLLLLHHFQRAESEVSACSARQQPWSSQHADRHYRAAPPFFNLQVASTHVPSIFDTLNGKSFVLPT